MTNANISIVVTSRRAALSARHLIQTFTISKHDISSVVTSCGIEVLLLLLLLTLAKGNPQPPGNHDVICPRPTDTMPAGCPGPGCLGRHHLPLIGLLPTQSTSCMTSMSPPRRLPNPPWCPPSGCHVRHDRYPNGHLHGHASAANNGLPRLATTDYFNDRLTKQRRYTLRG